jgi:hypothetical protein
MDFNRTNTTRPKNNAIKRITIPIRIFGRYKRSARDLVVSDNQRNIKNTGRQSTAKRRSEIATNTP